MAEVVNTKSQSQPMLKLRLNAYLNAKNKANQSSQV